MQNGSVSFSLTRTVGGGIKIDWSNGVQIVNNTISHNWARDCGGGLAIASGASSCASINLIVTGNSCDWYPYGWQMYSSNEACISYSDVEDWENTLGVYGEVIIGDGMLDADPEFETGPLSDFHLASSSPCVDAGSPDDQYNDPEDPMNPGYALWPALGFLRNDMGAYGGGGVGCWLGVEEEAEPPVPSDGLTLRVFPNPFRGSATLVFELTHPGQADLRLYDLSGRLVEELFSGDMVSGPMSCLLDGSRLPSGVYLARLQAGDQSATVRLVKL